MEGIEEGMEDKPGGAWKGFWLRLKVWFFMRLGGTLWQYVIYHDDHWGRFYGVTFTQERMFLKKLKYDLPDLPEL